MSVRIFRRKGGEGGEGGEKGTQIAPLPPFPSSLPKMLYLWSLLKRTENEKRKKKK